MGYVSKDEVVSVTPRLIPRIVVVVVLFFFFVYFIYS